MRLSEESRAEIRAALAGKRGIGAHTTARDMAARLKVSVPYLYHLTADVRATGRTARRDAGVSRITLTPEIALFIESLTHQADLSADHAIFITARHFGLADDFMAVATYNTWLRRKRQSRRDHKRDLRPYRSFEAARGNEMQQYDTTVAEAYYANDDGSIGYEPGYKRYKNKPGNKRPRLILYSLVDDCSRVLFARFYLSENAFNLLDFVFRGWSQKEDKRFPTYGIPDALYADQGSPRRSGKFVNAMQKLSVYMPDSTPSHAEPFGSRKHGKVERTFGEGLLGEFMKLTLIHRFTSLEELNATLWEWLIRLNNKCHSGTKEVRFARWLRTVGTPRSMPTADLFALLHYEHTQRVVSGNLQLSVNGKTYQLPYRKPYINWVGVRVEIYWYPGKEDTISVVYDHHEEEIRAQAPVIDLALDYKRAPKTEREERVEQLGQVNFAKVNIPAIYNSSLPYLPKKGTAFDDAKIATKTMTTADGKQRPSFVPTRYLSQKEVFEELHYWGLAHKDDNDRYDDPSFERMQQIMAGRETIQDEELTGHIARIKKEARRTGTEG